MSISIQECFALMKKVNPSDEGAWNDSQEEILEAIQKTSPTYSDGHKISSILVPTKVQKETMKDIFSYYTENISQVIKNIKLPISICTHLAGADFRYFVEELVPQFYSSGNLEQVYFIACINRQILDPTTGFLYNMFKSEASDPDQIDLFSADSPILQTTNGLLLQKLRSIIMQSVDKFFNETIQTDHKSPTDSICPISVINNIQSIIISPMAMQNNITCGFPARLEVLFTISQFQDMATYTKSHNPIKIKKPETIKTWVSRFTTITGMPPVKFDSVINLAPADSHHHFMETANIKLALFANPSHTDLDGYAVARKLFDYILGTDLELASFAIFWGQCYLFVSPDFAFPLFDEAFRIGESLGMLDYERYNTFLIGLSRFTDTLSCLSARYLDDERISNLNDLGLRSLCFSDPRIRKTAFKFLKILSHFETDKEIIFFYDFIKHFERQIEQGSVLSIESHHTTEREPLLPVIFQDALLTTEENVWQEILSTIGQLVAQQIPSDILHSFMRSTLTYLKSCPKEMELRNKMGTINMLTFLAALAEYPVAIFQRNVSNTTKNLIDKILHSLYDAMHEYFDVLNLGARLMIVPLNISSFPVFINLLDQSTDYRVVATALRSMSWNSDFSAICEHPDFSSSFFNLFKKLVNQFESHGLFSIDNRTHEDCLVLAEFMTSANQVLMNIRAKQQKITESPFPCCCFVLGKANADVSQLFNISYQFCHLRPEDKNEAPLRLLAIQCLSSFFACSSTDDDVIYTDEFFSSICHLSLEVPLLSLNVLTAHFQVFFPKYLPCCLGKDGTILFKAICSFFQATTTEDQLVDILKRQWMSIDVMKSDSPLIPHLQTIMENIGSLIFICLYYIASHNQELSSLAFILIASIAPSVLLYHERSQVDCIEEIMNGFLKIAKTRGYSMYGVELTTIVEISSILATHFGFALEQLLNKLFNNASIIEEDILNKMMVILIPWVKQICFDTENRVISKDTELLFMKFSCYSFVDRLISSFPWERKTIDANLLWRNLTTSDGSLNSNFTVILISIMSLVANPSNHDACQVAMFYLYQIAPETIIAFLTSYLSFGYFFHTTYRPSSDSTLLTEFLSYEEDECFDSNTAIEDFVLKTLEHLAHENIKPFLNSLPTIVAFAMTHFYEHYDRIIRLFGFIFKTLGQYIDPEAIPPLLELTRVFSQLPSSHSLWEQCAKIDHIDLEDIAALFAEFFTLQDADLSGEFGMELLRWGLISSNLKYASSALQAYRGCLYDTSSLVVGLSARALWTVSQAIQCSQSNLSIFTTYFEAMYESLGAIAQAQLLDPTFNIDSALFWIAMEGLKCNYEPFGEIFTSSLDVLILFLGQTSLFTVLRGGERTSNNQFSQSTFRKFHQPWGDSFDGCLDYLLLYTGDKPPVKQIIHCLNLIIQTQFLDLLSTNQNSVYAVLLALMPWIWKVVNTDLRRFHVDSLDVPLLAQTTDALQSLVDDEVIINTFNVIFQDTEIDSSSEMSKLSDRVIEKVLPEEISAVCNFLGNCLCEGDKMMKIPLYTTATKIAMKYEFSHSSLSKFTKLALGENVEHPSKYIEDYLDSVGSKVYEQEAPEGVVLPNLMMFERIVAVNIPHMYDINGSDDHLANFGDLNSFPPLIPGNITFDNCQKLAESIESLKQLRMEPFATYAELLTKLHMSLVDEDALSLMRKSEKYFLIDTPELIKQVLKPNEEEEDKADELSTDIQQSEDPETEHVVIINLDGDPFMFKSIEPLAFVPSVDDINLIGSDLFNGYEDEEVIYDEGMY